MWILYGATGVTGRMIAQASVERGLRPTIAGRSAAKVHRVAAEFGLDCVSENLNDPAGLSKMLAGADFVLNAAGPFERTMAPLVEACLETKTHYLDVSGEVDTFSWAADQSNRAEQQEIMLLPGVGFDVVASDCLAKHVIDALPDADHLAIGIQGLARPSPGSVKTMLSQAGKPVLIRQNHQLAKVLPGTLRRTYRHPWTQFEGTAVSWSDIVTAGHSTKVPNITVHFASNPVLEGALVASRLFGGILRARPLLALMKASAEIGPDISLPGNASNPCFVIAEAVTRDGRRASACLRSPEAYAFSADSASAVAARVLDGGVRAGFQTPALLFGADFVLDMKGVYRDPVRVSTV